MSLPHALITALVEQPSSGSDLASRFDRSIGYFWHATHQQIYRELGRLEESGWIESLPPESGRGRKRVYRVLPAGRSELQRFVADLYPVRAVLADRPACLQGHLDVFDMVIYDSIPSCFDGRSSAMDQQCIAKN